MTPFFTIIIPTLNEEYYLPKLLDRLEKQKVKNFELLIVDSQSEDHTKKVVREFAKKLPLTFLTVNKRSVSFQRNFGASKAKADYLIFLDADTGITTSFTKQVQSIIEKRKGLMFIPSIIPDEKNKFDVQVVFNFVNFLIDVSQSIGKPLSSGGSMIINKSFFYQIGGFDENLPITEDHNIVQRAQEWGVKAKFLQQVKVTFSLRRMRSEGRLKLLYKYLLSTMYVLFQGKIKKKIYNYEMGGQTYALQNEKYLAKNNKEDLLKTYSTKINKYFTKIFLEE